MSVRLMEQTMALLAKEAEGERWLGVTTCPKCGALVLAESVELHRRWHRVISLVEWDAEPHDPGEDIFAHGVSELEPLRERIAQLERERDEAIRQRDYDYHRFKEVKAALLEADKARVAAERELSDARSALQDSYANDTEPRGQ